MSFNNVITEWLHSMVISKKQTCSFGGTPAVLSCVASNKWETNILLSYDIRNTAVFASSKGLCVMVQLEQVERFQ